MAHRAQRRPQVSVLLAVQNGEDEITRCVESALAQTLRDIEVIVADLGSADHTHELLQRLAEHDFRLEVLSAEGARPDAGLAGALDSSRGERLLLLRQADWLAPSFLEEALVAASEASAPLVIPVSGDAGCPAHASARAEGADMGRSVADLLSTGVVDAPYGVLFDRALWERAAGEEPAVFEASCLLPALLGHADRIAVLETTSCHTHPADRPAGFDPALFDRCERAHGMLLERFSAWGLAEDPACREALHLHHLMGVARCVENACTGPGRLSSIERRQRVQDMIDASSTRASVEALRSAHAELGLMFTSIARGNASACYMSARLRGALNRVLAQLSHIRPLAASY